MGKALGVGELGTPDRVRSYSDLSARTSRSERDDAVLFPRLGLLSGDPARSDREDGLLNLAARASGDGKMCQMGSKMDMILATESVPSEI